MKNVLTILLISGLSLAASANGELLFKKCSACHGLNGEKSFK